MKLPSDKKALLISRYHEIVQRMEQACLLRDKKFTSPVTLIAVSKFQSVDQIEELYREGHRDFGENYVQELLEKDGELKKRGCSEIRWHFIGHLQKNKVKKLLPVVYCIHTIDSVELAGEVSRVSAQIEKTQSLPVFLEVNVDVERGKFGFMPDEVQKSADLIRQFSGIRIQGLMCIPSQGEDPQPRFAFLRECSVACQNLMEGFLSMGMSSDFELAIQEGATHVRVGTLLFGARSASNL